MKVLPNPRISQSTAAASELPYFPWSHLPLTKSGTVSTLCKIPKANSPGIPCGALNTSSSEYSWSFQVAVTFWQESWHMHFCQTVDLSGAAQVSVPWLEGQLLISTVFNNPLFKNGKNHMKVGKLMNLKFIIFLHGRDTSSYFCATVRRHKIHNFNRNSVLIQLPSPSGKERLSSSSHYCLDLSQAAQLHVLNKLFCGAASQKKWWEIHKDGHLGPSKFLPTGLHLMVDKLSVVTTFYFEIDMHVSQYYI